METPLSGVLRGIAEGFTLYSAMAEGLRAGQGQRLGTRKKDKSFAGSKTCETVECVVCRGKIQILPQHVYLCECTAEETLCMAWQ